MTWRAATTKISSHFVVLYCRFHTGDMGRTDDDGYIRVTGRLKEQYKLENGKYVVPTPIEEAIGMSRFISQCVLYGDNRPHNVVLIVPDWVAIRTELGIAEDVAEEELANDTRVAMLIDAEMQESCDKLKKFEVPYRVGYCRSIYGCQQYAYAQDEHSTTQGCRDICRL